MCDFFILAIIGVVIGVIVVALVEKTDDKPLYTVNKEEEYIELKGIFGNGGEWRRRGKWNNPLK